MVAKRVRAGRHNGGEWTIVYSDTGKRKPRAKLYGLGSNARASASTAAKAHNGKGAKKRAGKTTRRQPRKR